MSFLFVINNETETYKSTPTFIAEELSRNLLITTRRAKDLPANSAVMPTTKSGKPIAAVVTFVTVRVWHPIFLPEQGKYSLLILL